MKNYKSSRTNSVTVIAGRKLCYRCQRYKSLASFNNDKLRPDGKYPYCRACRKRYITNAKKIPRITNDYSKACGWCEAPIGGTHPNLKYCSDPCKSRASLAFSYGLTVEEYKSLIADMGGLCPICKRVVKIWHMDHEHESGETFGVVCTTCNTKLLAWTFHDIEIAKRLVEFLENPPVRTKYGLRTVTKKRITTTKWQKARRETLAAEGIYIYPHGLTRRDGSK